MVWSGSSTQSGEHYVGLVGMAYRTRTVTILPFVGCYNKDLVERFSAIPCKQAHSLFEEEQKGEEVPTMSRTTPPTQGRGRQGDSN
eukprot:8323909-Lingulodinium_polyedra.AAC.1